MLMQFKKNFKVKFYSKILKYQLVLFVCFCLFAVIQSHCICQTQLYLKYNYGVCRQCLEKLIPHLGVLLGVLEADPGPGRVPRVHTSSPLSSRESLFSKADLASENICNSVRTKQSPF